MGALKVMCGRALSLKGRAKRLSDCSLAYTDKSASARISKGQGYQGINQSIINQSLMI
jgi:hypothetical protein